MRHPFDNSDSVRDLKDLSKIDPIATTLALGEEGGDDPIATTLALGEEGGDDPILTTQAIGEEGGDDSIVTTLAIGEEGGDFGNEGQEDWGKIDPIATTLALGEEGGDDPILTTQAIGEEGGGDPIVTTLAIGEEGGDDPIATTQAIGEEGGDDPIVTTLAIGEEGGEFGNDILVSIQLPDDLKPTREARLDRVLDRVTALFGDNAVSALTEGRQDILITGPLTPKNAQRWGRLLTRMKQILGPENVFEAQNDGGAIGRHPFDLGKDPIQALDNLGSGTPTDLQVLPLDTFDNLTIATDTQAFPGL